VQSTVRSEGVPAVSGALVDGVADHHAKANGTRESPAINFERVLDEHGRLDGAGFKVAEAELAEEARWEDLALLYELGAQRATDPDLGRTIMLSAGLLLFEKIGDFARAETVLRHLLASDPGNAEALDALRTITAEQGRYEEAADLLDQAINVAA